MVFTCDDISFGGYRIDRTMTYKNIDRRLQTNLEEYNRLIASMEEKRQKNISVLEYLHSGKQSVGINEAHDISAGISGTDGASGGGSPIVEKIAATAMEVTAQPHMTPVSGGGGGSDNDRGWRDDENENENDRQYVPYRRRR